MSLPKQLPRFLVKWDRIAEDVTNSLSQTGQLKLPVVSLTNARLLCKECQGYFYSTPQAHDRPLVKTKCRLPFSKKIATCLRRERKLLLPYLIDIFLFMALSIEKQIVYRIAFLGRFNG
jgi:hypothetical protein